MELVLNFTVGLLKGVSAELMGKILGYGIGGAIAFWLIKKTKIIFNTIMSPFRNYRKVKRARDAISSQKGIWLSIPVTINEVNKPNCPVVLVANLKGGVGKTTLTANLTAHCAVKKQETTLCIDFDYQGSLTSMALANQFDADDIIANNSRAGRLVSGQYTDEMLFTAAIPLPQQPNSLPQFPPIRFIPADYPLAQVENRLMISWILGDLDFDLRTKLSAEFVKSPFDRIIIDAPPRLTTGCIQGLYASTHIIIPTILDRLATQAVGRFIEQIYDLRRNNLCPFLTKITVVGTMASLGHITDQSEHEFLKLALSKYSDIVEIVPFELSVLNKTILARSAGHNIAYLVDSEAIPYIEMRQMFDNLGDHIWE